MKKLLSQCMTTEEWTLGFIVGSTLNFLSPKDVYEHTEEIIQQLYGTYYEVGELHTPNSPKV